MMPVSASAPGKIVISGEYAVLFGAPAIAVAIDHRAAVSVEGAAELCRVQTVGYCAPPASFRVRSDGGIDWQGDANIPLLESVWQAFDGKCLLPATMLLDTKEFFDQQSGCKFGLGSSAALCCAMVLALAEFSATDCDALSLASTAHKSFQEGRGSGVDIVTSLHGGLIEYRMPNATGPTSLKWPDNLHWLPVWSGSAVATSSQLDKLAIASQTDKGVSDFVAAAESIAMEWRRGNASQVLTQLESYSESLMKFDQDYQLGIYAGGHNELRQMASRRQILYKPCGAGGGDIGVAFAADQAALQDFRRDAEKSGYRVLDAQQDSSGAALVNGVLSG